MLHKMNLWEGPFTAIRQGRKTVELRLYDEKRQRIAPGDTIEFTKAKTGEALSVLVTATRVFPNFAQLYLHYDKIAMGYEEAEIPDHADMDQYYPPEKQAKYGVVAIEIQLL